MHKIVKRYKIDPPQSTSPSPPPHPSPHPPPLLPPPQGISPSIQQDIYSGDFRISVFLDSISDIYMHIYVHLQIDMSGQYSCMNRLLVSLLYRHIQIYTFIDRHVRTIFMHEQTARVSSLQTYSDIYIYRQTCQENIYA